MRLVRIGVGIGYEHQHAWVERALKRHDLPTEYDEFEDFDMASWPEKGDAVDHIKSGDVVVGVHLAFSERLCKEPTYFYNRFNGDLVVLCALLKVPLILIGEQPDMSNVPLGRLYA